MSWRSSAEHREFKVLVTFGGGVVYIAPAAVIAAAILSLALESESASNIRPMVAADQGAMIVAPEAEFVLARSRQELDDALEAQKVRQGRLMILADSETGPGLIYDFGPRFPAAGALAAAQDVELARKVGEYYGNAFAVCGFDVVMAPVADLFKGSPAVGWRALAGRMETALPIAEILVDSIAAGGTVPFIKHYPGHGGTLTDSHNAGASIEMPWEDFVSDDLAMFRHLCDQPSLGGVMLGHIGGSRNPSFGWPAGSEDVAMISPFWMNLIRRDWKYDGVLVSDALVMNAAMDIPGGEAYCSSRFLQLGGDLLLGMDMTKGDAEHAIRLYTQYHGGSAAHAQSNHRLNKLWEAVSRNRRRREALNPIDVQREGAPLANRLAQKSLIAAGPWKRPLNLASLNGYLWATGGGPSKYSDPKSAFAALDIEFSGAETTGTLQPESLLMVFGYVTDPAFDANALNRLAAEHENGNLKGVVVCGWPGAVYQLASAGVPAVSAWGSSEASMIAVGRWLKSADPAPGKWPYGTTETVKLSEEAQ